MRERIESHRDLIVFQKSFEAGCKVFEVSRGFPREEMYSLTDQLRRSARSVSANIAEAWRKRRYIRHFCSTLNVAEAEAAETQVWLDFAVRHKYIDQSTAAGLQASYDEIVRMLVAMIFNANKWCIASPTNVEGRRSTKGTDPEGVNESNDIYRLDADIPHLNQHLLLDSPDSPSPNSPSPNQEQRDG